MRNELYKEEYVNILHLSDFHYDNTLVGSSAETRDAVLSACVDYCSTLRSDASPLLPNIVAITGDISMSGKIDDYSAFHKDFLSKLLSSLGIGVDRVVICPGNHDVEWSATIADEFVLNRSNSTKHPKEMPTAYSGLFNGFTTYLENNHFASYNNCINTERDSARKFLKFLYGYRVIEDIHFIVLNSAWNSRNTRDTKFGDDYGKLFLGREFVLDALKPVRNITIPRPIVIALAHHPFFYDTKKPKEPYKAEEEIYISNEYQWLDNSEVLDINAPNNNFNNNHNVYRPVTQIERDVNIVLTGHLHKPVGPLVVGNCGTSGYIVGSMDPKESVGECGFQILRVDKSTGKTELHRFKCYRNDYGGNGNRLFSIRREEPIYSPNLHKSVDMLNLARSRMLQELEQEILNEVNPKEADLTKINNPESKTNTREVIQQRAKKDLLNPEVSHERRQ